MCMYIVLDQMFGCGEHKISGYVDSMANWFHSWFSTFGLGQQAYKSCLHSYCDKFWIACTYTTLWGCMWPTWGPIHPQSIIHLAKPVCHTSNNMTYQYTPSCQTFAPHHTWHSNKLLHHTQTLAHTHTECICTIICTYVWWLFGNWPHLIMGCISYVAWFIAEQGCWSWGTCLTWHVGGPWVRDEFETTPQFYWAAYLWTFNDGYWCYKYVPHIGCHSSMVATSVEDWMEHST